MTNIESQKPDVPEKIRTRLLSRFCFYLGLIGFLIAVVIKIGLYINCGALPSQAIGPHPMIGKIVEVIGYAGIVIGIGIIAGLFAIVVAPFRQPRLRNFAVALAGFLLALTAKNIAVLGLTGDSPARDMWLLKSALKEYTKEYADQLPSPNNWRNDLFSFQSFRISYLKTIVRQDPEHFHGYGMNINIGGKKLIDLPPDTVVLFETETARNPAGGAELMTTKNHNGKGCFVLFANNQIKFVRPEDFNNLRWKP